MATNIWTGNASDVPDIYTFTVDGAWDGSEVVTLKAGNNTYDGNEVDIAIDINGALTTAQVAQDLTDAWNGTTPTNGSTVNADASDIPQFAEATASISGSTVTITADTAGVPIDVGTPTIAGGTGTISGGVTHSQTATGKHFANNVDNWSNHAVPVNADTVYFLDNDVDCLYEMGALSAVTAAINILNSYTGNIGLPRNNDNGYTEYRLRKFQTAATVINIGRGEGIGSGRIVLDSTTTNNVVLTVYDTGTSEDTEVPAVAWEGSGTGVTVNARGGDLGLGVTGDTAAVATLNVESASVSCGVDCTVTTINHRGTGDVMIWANAVTTITMDGGGSVAYLSDSALTTLTINAGTFSHQGDGNITTLTLGAAGVFSNGDNPNAVTVTNCTAYPGGSIDDPSGQVTWSNGIVLTGGRLSDYYIDVGVGRTITPS